jgi:hypothetical protein
LQGALRRAVRLLLLRISPVVATSTQHQREQHEQTLPLATHRPPGPPAHLPTCATRNTIRGANVACQVTRRYEKEMFTCVADDLMAVFLDVFYGTRRHDLVLKMLHALFEYATVAAHFGLTDQVSAIVITHSPCHSLNDTSCRSPATRWLTHARTQWTQT